MNLPFIASFKHFFQEMKKNPPLLYSWLLTIGLMVFYGIIAVIFGSLDSLPLPGQILDIQGVTFLLLISYSFFLLFLFIASWINSLYQWIKIKQPYLKLSSLHIIIFILSLLIPIFIFVGMYIAAYFIWYSLSAVFLVLFAKDLSNRFLGKLSSKKGLKGYLVYILFWLISIVAFGAFFLSINWSLMSFNKQMILLVFPLFILVLPVIGLILKPNSGFRAPITFYSILIFGLMAYHWIRYLNWTGTASTFTLSDIILDSIIITYTFYTLFKNADKITKRVKEKIKIDQLLLLFIWTRISSMIILHSVSEYTIFEINASEGTYLATMFMLIIIGLIFGIIWIKKGFNPSESKGTINLPELAGDNIRN